MDLTLQSALSPAALLGHASYILLILSMMSDRMGVLRLLVGASAVVAIFYAVFILNDPVGTFWETLLLTVSVVQLTRLWLADRRARLSPEEAALVEGRLRMRSRGAGRRLLDTGDWVALPPGARLTEEGARPEALWFVAAGEVEIVRGGAPVAVCRAGNFVGEMAMLEEGAPASATAVARGPVRAWRLPYAKLARLATAQPDAHGALHGAIARDMRGKIVGAPPAAPEPAE